MNRLCCETGIFLRHAVDEALGFLARVLHGESNTDQARVAWPGTTDGHVCPVHMHQQGLPLSNSYSGLRPP